jgi:hypothetical protein
MPGDPLGVDFPGLGIRVTAIEEHHAGAVIGACQQLQQVVLRAAGFGKDDGLLRSAEFVQFLERHVEGLQQGGALGVFGDRNSQIAEGFEFADFGLDGGDFGCGRYLGAASGDGIEFVGEFVEGFVVLVKFFGKVGSRRLFVEGLA